MHGSLADICRAVRKDVLSMIFQAGSGHPGSSLSSVEIICTLYFSDILKYDISNPDWRERDRFIISKGHAVPALYSVLARIGFFPESELCGLRRLGSILQGHPRLGTTPGIDCSGGSLGQGLSIANGIAMGYKHQNIKSRVYCLLGDGELQEGQIWEAVLTAAQLKLSNVCAMIDNNGMQLDGTTASIKKMDSIPDKFKSFGWNVIETDGHNPELLENAYRSAIGFTCAPSVIICKTIKGKGISFMEHNCDWHSNPPTVGELELAISELGGASK